MNKKALIHAWSIRKKDNKYYLPFTHWIYLKEIIKYFDEVILLSPCKSLKEKEKPIGLELSSLFNVTVYEVPSSSKGYLGSLKYFPSYVKAYYSIKDVTTYYARYPVPFGWLQNIFGKKSKKIIHYVGDPIDAAKNNPNFSFLKKKLLVGGFYLENSLYDWACKSSNVYTNGTHLSEKLRKKGITASPLISSTLTKDDFHYTEKKIDPHTAKFIYLGYLRTAKGIETIIEAFSMYNIKYPHSTFVIIGSGELEKQLKNIIFERKINNVQFHGNIDDRTIINKELRSADIFLFASLSEGSPRVVLEAMANGLAVISTPVGSLPAFFKDNENIIFSDFNNSSGFFSKMDFLTKNNIFYNTIRTASYNKVKEVTIDKFIKEIFYE